MKIEETWAKKREAFFATNLKCTECGGDFDHYSRTMICRKCQIIKYRKTARAKEPEYRRRYVKKHRVRIRAYQKNYYLAHKDEISLWKKMRYHEKRRAQ